MRGIQAATAAPPQPALGGTVARAGDDELVAATRAGDDRAFEALYQRYRRPISGYVLGLVKDHQRAEDVTQDVFINALRRMRKTDRAIAVRPWLYEIARNACIDQFRRARRADEVSYDAGEAVDSLPSRGPTPDAAVRAKQDLDDLCGAFAGLSDSHHRILVMRELEGLTYEQIGERLGMTRPAVESTLFRARRRLTEEHRELVTGERCRRVQAIIAGTRERSLGARDRRRMARHLSHCQPCRRVAVLAGLGEQVPARTGVRAKIAGLLPLPAVLRERWLGLGEGGGSPAGWLHAAAPLLDAGSGGWMKAAAVGATLAVAGVGVNAVRGGAGDGGGAAAVRPGAGAAPAAPGAGQRALAGGPRGAVGAASTGGVHRIGAAGRAPARSGPAGGGGGGGTTRPASGGSGSGSQGAGAGPAAPSRASHDGSSATGSANRVTSGAGRAVRGLAGRATGTAGSTTGAVGGVVQGTAGTATGVVQGATGVVGGTVGGATGTVSGTVQATSGAAVGVVQGAAGAVSGVVGGATGALTGAPAPEPQASSPPAGSGAAAGDVAKSAGDTVTQTTTRATGAVDGVAQGVGATADALGAGGG